MIKKILYFLGSFVGIGVLVFMFGPKPSFTRVNNDLYEGTFDISQLE